VLVVAGSDSSGGAGMQADIRTLGALGIHCACALTAVTAQDTRHVAGILPVPATLLDSQIELAIGDFTILATKIGMLATEDNVIRVAQRVQAGDLPNVVVDPVLASSSGKSLIDQDGIRAYREQLLPAALLVTPNIPEAELLTGMAIGNEADMARAGTLLVEMGATVAMVKGGHVGGSTSMDVVACGASDDLRIAIDALAQDSRPAAPDGTSPSLDVTGQSPEGVISQSSTSFHITTTAQGNRSEIVLTAPRVRTKNTRGTGCTLSSAIAAYMARGDTVVDAIVKAKYFVTAAIAGASQWTLGKGNGPIDQLGWNEQS